MKKLLFATAFASTALASSMGCNTDTLTGLHFGLGVSVLFDKYEADVDVGTVVPYSKVITNVNAITVGDTDGNIKSNDVKQLVTDIWNGVPAMVATGDQEAPNVKAVLTTGTDGYAANNFITYGTSSGQSSYYAMRSLAMRHATFNRRTTNCGGEIKLAYFHDFGNHLMIGVDLTGVIASKNRKTIRVLPEMANYPETIAAAIGDNKYSFRNIDPSTGNVKDASISGSGPTTANDSISVGTTFTELLGANKEKKIVLMDTWPHDASAGQEGKADKSFNEMALITAQYKLGDQTVDDPGQLTFEKSVFNPRLAFIVGGTVYGWFAGLRLGMSYTTGKVYATGGKLTGQGTQSKTVSISSPLIGLHLMKQLKIAGNNDAHLYLTADWNIGDGRRSVYMNGVRNFRQTGYNISAGITWRFKLGN